MSTNLVSKSKWAAAIVIVCRLILNLAACTIQKSGYQISDEPYGDWKRVTVGKVVMIYPEGHMHEPEMNRIASGYESAQTKLCNLFSIPVPPDSIYVYYYTGLGQGRDMTGHEWVFADSNHLHFWMPSYPSVVLMDYLIPKWIPVEPKHGFLKSGLIALFDYSGTDYHESLLNFIDRDILISLDSLGRDTTSNVNEERYASGEAASFVAFYLDTYGMKSFENLYQAQDDFNAALLRETGLVVDSVQTLWIKFANDKYEQFLNSTK